jgi:hypothetical protein
MILDIRAARDWSAQFQRAFATRELKALVDVMLESDRIVKHCKEVKEKKSIFFSKFTSILSQFNS